MTRVTSGDTIQIVRWVGDEATTAQVTVSATSMDLAAYGLEPEYFDYPRLLRSEEAGRRGEHRPAKESLDRVRARLRRE